MKYFYNYDIIRESEVDEVNWWIYGMQNIMSSKELFLLMIKCLKKGKLSNSNKNLEVDQRVTLVVVALIYLTTKNLEEKLSNGKSIFKYNLQILIKMITLYIL